ncbi:MAG TPA: hypothetical protein VLK25_00860, partial [Allosphingosinicella sp.]|nr:hypothetical protein [Allosphingosinicella sp.]
GAMIANVHDLVLTIGFMSVAQVDFDLMNEIAALEGLGMQPDNYARMQLVQANLLRRWGDKP